MLGREWVFAEASVNSMERGFMASTDQKRSRMQFTAMVAGSLAGAGIFLLPRTFAGATGDIGNASGRRPIQSTLSDSHGPATGRITI